MKKIVGCSIYNHFQSQQYKHQNDVIDVTPFSDVFVVDFEQMNVRWVGGINIIKLANQSIQKRTQDKNDSDNNSPYF